MMILRQNKLIIAIVIAVVGIALAWRAMNRAGVSPAPSAPAEAPVSPIVEKMLAEIEFDTHPTKETAATVASDAAQLARNAASAFVVNGAIDPARLDDLAEAFRERFLTTIYGDYEMNRNWLKARGDTFPDETADQFRSGWEAEASRCSLPPLSLSQLVVRMISKGGNRLAPDPVVDSGWRTLVGSFASGRFPLPKDPVEAGLDVVEVRLPVQRATVFGGGDRKVLIGYRFAWSDERSQWIPWNICIYIDPKETNPFESVLF